MPEHVPLSNVAVHTRTCLALDPVILSEASVPEHNFFFNVVLHTRTRLSLDPVILCEYASLPEYCSVLNVAVLRHSFHVIL